MRLIFLFGAAAFIFSSCDNNNGAESVSCSGVEVSFAKDVMPIITSSCATNSTCHGTGSHEGPGALTSYSLVNAARTDIDAAVSSGAMPKNSSLTKDQRNTIICWIRNGALNN